MNYELLKKKIVTALTLNCKVGEYYNAKKGKKMNFYIAPDNIDYIIPTINSTISDNNSLALIKGVIGELILDIDFSKAKGFHFSSKLKDKVITVKDVIDLDKIIASCNDVKIVKKENPKTKKVVNNKEKKAYNKPKPEWSTLYIADNKERKVYNKTTKKSIKKPSKEQPIDVNDNKPKWNILYIFDNNRNAMVYYGTKKFSVKGKGTLKTLPIAFTEDEVLKYIEDYLKENKIVRKIIKNMDKEK